METKFTKVQLILETFSLLLLLFLCVYILSNWAAIPQTVPSHFDFTGTPDGWSSKYSLLFLLTVCFLLYALLTVVSFFPAIWNVPVTVTEENKELVYRDMRNLLLAVKAEIITAFTYIMFGTIRYGKLSPYFLPVFLIALFGTIITFTLLAIKRGKTA